MTPEFLGALSLLAGVVVYATIIGLYRLIRRKQPTSNFRRHLPHRTLIRSVNDDGVTRVVEYKQKEQASRRPSSL